MSKIAFIKSDDRSYNIDRCLSLIKSEIIIGLKNAKKVVVKPNCVTDNIKLAATNAAALDAVLNFISPYVETQIILAEGASIGNTLKAFKNFGYLNIQEKYDFTIVDLNNDNYDSIELLDRKGKPREARIAKTLTSADYIISISPPKTHDSVVYTGAIKNAAVGSLLRPDENLFSRLASKLGFWQNNKMMIRQSPKIINENIKRIFRRLSLKLAVLDGFEAMQGDGPINGELIPAHFAIASSDPVAADWFACIMMGIDVKNVGYLSLLGAGEKEHFIIGDTWQDKIIRFKLHHNFETIRKWR